MKVDVYRNLHQKCFSIRSREKDTYGKVIARAQNVAVRNAKFVVQPAGREKVVRTGTKNVHAFVRGDLVTDVSPEDAWHSIPLEDEWAIFYWPKQWAYFLGGKLIDGVSDGLGFVKANKAKVVLLTGGRHVKAKGVE